MKRNEKTTQKLYEHQIATPDNKNFKIALRAFNFFLKCVFLSHGNHSLVIPGCSLHIYIKFKCFSFSFWVVLSKRFKTRVQFRWKAATEFDRNDGSGSLWLDPDHARYGNSTKFRITESENQTNQIHFFIKYLWLKVDTHMHIQPHLRTEYAVKWTFLQMSLSARVNMADFFKLPSEVVKSGGRRTSSSTSTHHLWPDLQMFVLRRP